MRKYEAVFFDATNTLIYPYPSIGEIYARIGRAHGHDVSADDLAKSFMALWRKEQSKRVDFTSRFGTSEIEEKEWWHRIAKAAFKDASGSECSDECFDELFEVFACGSSWKLFPEVKDVLHELSARGYVIGVISNFDSRLLKICRELGLEDMVDFILVSGIFGFEKPDRRIFAEGVYLARTSASRCLHVGDDYIADFTGAKSAGLDALLLMRDGEKCSGICRDTISDLRKIFPILEFAKNNLHGR